LEGGPATGGQTNNAALERGGRLVEPFIVPERESLARTNAAVHTCHRSDERGIRYAGGFKTEVLLEFPYGEMSTFAELAVDVAVIEPEIGQLALELRYIVSPRVVDTLLPEHGPVAQVVLGFAQRP
jgi:hypothetical protein